MLHLIHSCTSHLFGLDTQVDTYIQKGELGRASMHPAPPAAQSRPVVRAYQQFVLAAQGTLPTIPPLLRMIFGQPASVISFAWAASPCADQTCNLLSCLGGKLLASPDELHTK